MRNALIRSGLIGVLLATLAIAMVNHWLDPNAVTHQLREHADIAVLLFVAYHVIASLFFVPRSLLGVAAGALFGLWLGLALAMVGSVLGALLGFLTARMINRGLIDPTEMPRIGPWLKRAEEAGFRTALLIRLSPLPNSLVNYTLGLSRIKTLPYLAGTALGMLPVAIITVNVGASGADVLGGQADLLPLVSWGGAFIALVGFSAWIAPRLAKKGAPGDDQEASG